MFVYYFTEFSKIYKKLGVTIIDRGESFYQPMMPDVVKDLEAKGQFYTEQVVSERYKALCIMFM